MKQIVPNELIEKKIYFIRGQKVMLDRDLASLYGVETRALNQAVRRNIDRFPTDFMFFLTRKEILNLSQVVISSNIKHAPNVLVFIEHGVAMLSGVLKSKRATLINIQIIRTFIYLRKVLSASKQIVAKLKGIEKRLKKHDTQIVSLFETVQYLLDPPSEEMTKGKFGFI